MLSSYDFQWACQCYNALWNMKLNVLSSLLHFINLANIPPLRAVNNEKNSLLKASWYRSKRNREDLLQNKFTKFITKVFVIKATSFGAVVISKKNFIQPLSCKALSFFLCFYFSLRFQKFQREKVKKKFIFNKKLFQKLSRFSSWKGCSNWPAYQMCRQVYWNWRWVCGMCFRLLDRILFKLHASSKSWRLIRPASDKFSNQFWCFVEVQFRLHSNF